MTAPLAIVCLGNRLTPADDLGPRVHDHLATDRLPNDIALLDGGLKGLDLWPELDGRRRVVFADVLAGESGPGVAVIRGAAVTATAPAFGHGAGLPYLLAMLPHVAASVPETAVVGAPAPAETETVHAVARRCLEVVTHDLP